MTDPGHRLDTAPCGQCGELVPRLTGCPHWRPVKAAARAITMRRVREKRAAQKKVAR